jgi:hypothetical protein
MRATPCKNFVMIDARIFHRLTHRPSTLTSGRPRKGDVSPRAAQHLAIMSYLTVREGLNARHRPVHPAVILNEVKDLARSSA